APDGAQLPARPRRPLAAARRGAAELGTRRPLLPCRQRHVRAGAHRGTRGAAREPHHAARRGIAGGGVRGADGRGRTQCAGGRRGEHRRNRTRAAKLFPEPLAPVRGARGVTGSAVLGIGLVISLLYSELFGVAPGGIIVPGYLALAIPQPLTVLLTIGAALLTYFVVQVLASIAIVYGRRRTVLSILIGFLLGALVRNIG